MSALTFKGIEQKAYRLVINHCPPAINVELELELTRLAATALIVGIDECWVASQLENCSVEAISVRIRQSMH